MSLEYREENELKEFLCLAILDLYQKLPFQRRGEKLAKDLRISKVAFFKTFDHIKKRTFRHLSVERLEQYKTALEKAEPDTWNPELSKRQDETLWVHLELSEYLQKVPFDPPQKSNTLRVVNWLLRNDIDVDKTTIRKLRSGKTLCVSLELGQKILKLIHQIPKSDVFENTSTEGKKASGFIATVNPVQIERFQAVRFNWSNNKEINEILSTLSGMGAEITKGTKHAKVKINGHLRVVSLTPSTKFAAKNLIQDLKKIGVYL
jgi:hypothetical protein